MLYIVELHYSQEHQDAALNYFFDHGLTRYEGRATVNGAWIAKQDRIVYALVDAADSEEMAKACAPLERFGAPIVRPVTSVDQM